MRYPIYLNISTLDFKIIIIIVIRINNDMLTRFNATGKIHFDLFVVNSDFRPKKPVFSSACHSFSHKLRLKEL